MPKMKTKSAAKKRFSVTGSGRIKRKHAYHSHILTKKSVKRNAKHTIRKSADSISFIPVTSDDAHAHLSVSNAAPKSVQNSPSDCVKDVTLKLGSRE